MSKEEDHPGSPQEQETARDQAFYIKVPEIPQVASAEADHLEQQLLSNLKARGPRSETLKPLAVFYSRVSRQEHAYQYLKMWMKHAKNKEELAECLLMSGQLAEQVGQPEPAIAFYREALAQNAGDAQINYYLHNNLAYCLNLQGEFEKALTHCETAIKIDPSRANGYKNLGVSQAGLGRYAQAAKAWIQATHVNVSDARACELLSQCLEEHAEALRREIPDIDEQASHCRRAVQTAQTGRFADWARGLTLN
ncbi:tetratricopeptide repeat protein [candidate division FCPU426 bacterium]|nr:tetratricopeptide repeat protein [candidate division FCPU426 bacterium]